MIRYSNVKSLAALLLLMSIAISSFGQCIDCSTLTCDGIQCDDSTPSDGVMTSSKCSCGRAISGACAEVIVNLGQNPYFDIYDSNSRLYLETQQSGNFNIYFVDEACTVEDCASPDFVVSGSEFVTGFPRDQVFKMIICKAGGNGGRRDFNFSISSTTIENCINGLDDDADTFIDCDDGGCNTDPNCEYTSTSSGSNGGLESNGRLSQKIASRNYFRTLSGHGDNEIRKNRNLYRGLNNDQIHKREKRSLEKISLTSILPEFDGKYEVYISTPADLLDITNAIDVAALDIYQYDQRIASVFTTMSENGVYEHTKYICDRLQGAQILNIWESRIEGFPFIITKFSRPDGEIEYAVNFSFFPDSEKTFQLESHWNLADYTYHSTYYNIQLWAQNMSVLEDLISSTLRSISDIGSISGINTSNLPEVYVKGINYNNGHLNLELENRSQLDSITLTTLVRNTELETSAAREDHVLYLSSVKQQLIQVEIQDSYAIGGTLSGASSGSSDSFYYADGSWGLDLLPGSTIINNYEIRASENNISQEFYSLKRDVHLSGSTNDYMALYRSLNAAFRPVDLSRFNILSFTASGKGDLQITILREEIKDWEKQLRLTIPMDETEKEFRIPSTQFLSFDDIKDWSDVKMIVFKFETTDPQVSQYFELNISDLKFEYDEAVAFQTDFYSFLVKPNPVRDRMNLAFMSDSNCDFTLHVYDTFGNLVMDSQGQVNVGINQFTKPVHNLENGIYVIKLNTSAGQVMKGKILKID